MDIQDDNKEEIEKWLFGATQEEIEQTDPKYLDCLFKQYQLYVEMADRISARRDTTNGFFLGLQTLIVTGIVYSFVNIDYKYLAFIYAFLIMGAALCHIWHKALSNYRLINSSKYDIILLLEARLPARGYGAEWKVLKLKKYVPLTAIEGFVPRFFGYAYLVIAIFYFLSVKFN